MPLLELILDVVMMGLLGFTIFYCWNLSRRIRVLQDGRSELAELPKHFDESTMRASESILALQSASKKIGETIQGRIDKARFAIDDLSFLIEKAEGMVAGADTAKAARPSPPPPPKEQPLPEAAAPRSLGPLAAMLSKIASRHDNAKEAKPADATRARSQAEEELLRMIRNHPTA